MPAPIVDDFVAMKASDFNPVQHHNHASSQTIQSKASKFTLFPAGFN
jgi:hypothetical protein